MKNYTKKDINTLKTILNGAILESRPLGDSISARVEWAARIREKLPSLRYEIIVAGLKSSVAVAHSRAYEYEKTASHFTANPQVYGKSTKEVVDRFAGYGAREIKSVASLGKLLRKVCVEGLPFELQTYVPDMVKL